jgi:26S proteasome regulatory subunit N11
MVKLSKSYAERIIEENTKTEEEVQVANTGKIDPKNHLIQAATDLLDSNILQSMTTMLDTIVF